MKPDKEKSTEKIDGALTTIIALDQSLRTERKTSIYDDREIFIL